MRRFVVSGLVPCAADELATRLLDFADMPSIWPQIRRRRVVRAGADWWECSTDELVGDAVEERLSTVRRISAVEVTEQVGGAHPSLTVHRFLPAEGGCLWAIESRAEPGETETWAGFVRRRRRQRAAAELLVDAAAGYFASHR